MKDKKALKLLSIMVEQLGQAQRRDEFKAVELKAIVDRNYELNKQLSEQKERADCWAREVCRMKKRERDDGLHENDRT